MNLVEIFNIKEKELITITGGGGKSTLMFLMAEELLEKKMKHIVTTTTKICLSKNQKGQLLSDIEIPEMIAKINSSSEIQWILGTEMVNKEKVYGFSEKELTLLFNHLHNSIVLNEGDGAKRKPYKFYAHYEPVIPRVTTKLIHVIGAEVFYKKINGEYFHRWEKYGDETKVFDEKVFEESLENYRDEKLSSKLGEEVSKILLINKAQGENYENAKIMGKIGKGIFDEVYISALQENWIEKC